MFSGNGSEHREQIRIDVPTWYEDARGEQEGIGKHAVFLPHEIVGSLYHFPHVNLTDKLFGDPGVPWLHVMFILFALMLCISLGTSNWRQPTSTHAIPSILKFRMLISHWQLLRTFRDIGSTRWTLIGTETTLFFKRLGHMN